MIITIDGPSGTGKSSTAKALAERLGYLHLDTGAMYRALTYWVLFNGVDPTDEEGIYGLLPSFSLRIEEIDGVKHYLVNDVDATREIRSRKVTQAVSQVSAFPYVRREIVAIQRSIGEGRDLVAEGRDLGSVVFTNAEIKIFLTASPEVRADRRHKELAGGSPSLTPIDILVEQKERDDHDMAREHSPLRPAEGAIILDTSNLSLDEVVNRILDIISQKTNKE